MKVRIYHNPRCSKSREALRLLRERGLEPEIVEYLKTPPSPGTLRALLRRMGIGARDLLRRREPPFRELGLADPEKSEEELIRAMVAHPVLIERPIVETEKGVRIGRPPEKILEIL